MAGNRIDVGMPDSLLQAVAAAEAQRILYEKLALSDILKSYGLTLNDVRPLDPARNPHPSQIVESPPEPDVLEPSQAEILDECAREPETDIGNARRLLIRFGDRIRFVPRVGWHTFDGMRFKEDEDGSGIRPLAQRTAEFIDDEAILLDANPEEQAKIEAGKLAVDELKKLGKPGAKWTADALAQYEKLRAEVEAWQVVSRDRAGRMSSRHSHAKSAAGTTKLNNMLREAEPHCAKMVTALNADLLAINTENCTLRFVRSDDDGKWAIRMDRHKPEDFITKLAPVRFNVNAPAPTFDKFLSEVMPSEDMRRFLQRFMGYSLLGLVNEHCLLFFYGTGRNGKSTFAELFADVLGDYAVSMSIDSFAGDQQRKGSDATPDLARLPGVRLITAEEPEIGIKLKGALIKKMTGGTKMDVRKLNQEFFELSPQFKIILSGNHKPIIVDDSEGMWARVHMIPWDVRIEKERIDRDLPEKLRLERDGIFAWAVRGALDYLEGGLRPPQQVTDATEEYRQDSDPIGDFIRNGCLVTGNSLDRQTPGDLFEAFKIYARKNGLPEFHQATFTRRLPDQAKKDWRDANGKVKQFWRQRSNGTVYCGLQIIEQLAGTGGSSPPHGRFSDEDPFPEEFP